MNRIVDYRSLVPFLEKNGYGKNILPERQILKTEFEETQCHTFRNKCTQTNVGLSV